MCSAKIKSVNLLVKCVGLAGKFVCLQLPDDVLKPRVGFVSCHVPGVLYRMVCCGFLTLPAACRTAFGLLNGQCAG